MKIPNIHSKARRVLDFIMGARDPKVWRALGPYGFSRSVMGEAVVLLKRATTLSLQGGTDEPFTEEGVAARMDAFENLWFPIAKSTLLRHHPKVSEALFENITRSRGRGTTFGLITFLTRLGAMSEGAAPFGDEGKVARDLLTERGLTPAVAAQGRALVEEIADKRPEVTPPNREDQEEALAALWAWYLEWSGIARAVIKDRSMLRTLGFRQTRATDPSPEDASDEEEAESVKVLGEWASQEKSDADAPSDDPEIPVPQLPARDKAS